MLPTAGGTTFNQYWYASVSETVDVEYDLSLLDNPDEFEVIAFVQNNTTKEVYQVAYNDNAYLSTAIEQYIANVTEKGFVIYPNPSTGYFNLEFTTTNERTISVYNQFGQLVNHFVTYEVNNSLNLSNLAAGVYYLNINQDNNTSTEKLIITK
jgi:hypothetical protein